MSRVSVLSRVHVAVGNWATYIWPCRNFNKMTNNGALQLWSGIQLATDHRSTEEEKHKLKWSQIAPMSSIRDRQCRSQDLPGPYLCTARDTLTALRTEDIWNMFCFSCPFMSFEVAISFGRCRYFLAHVACRNLPWQGLTYVFQFIKIYQEYYDTKSLKSDKYPERRYLSLT